MKKIFIVVVLTQTLLFTTSNFTHNLFQFFFATGQPTIYLLLAILANSQFAGIKIFFF